MSMGHRSETHESVARLKSRLELIFASSTGSSRVDGDGGGVRCLTVWILLTDEPLGLSGKTRQVCRRNLGDLSLSVG